MTDGDRLDWLAKQDGIGLVNDDFGHWAVATAGMQSVPDGVGSEDGPWDISTSFIISKAEWRDTIREAIDAAISEFGDE